MLHSSDLLVINTMPSWSDISLALYKEFSELYLLPSVFRYHLENECVIDVRFEEWAIYHMLGIQHINGKISKTKFFEEIENGLDFDLFIQNKKLKKRLNDFKHRIRMFACIYQIMKDEKLFYVREKQLGDSSVKADYIKYALIDNKGANVGIRYFENQYIAYTMLIDRNSNPTATVEGLLPIKIEKLEIIRNGEIVDTVIHQGCFTKKIE